MHSFVVMFFIPSPRPSNKNLRSGPSQSVANAPSERSSGTSDGRQRMTDSERTTTSVEKLQNLVLAPGPFRVHTPVMTLASSFLQNGTEICQ